MLQFGPAIEKAQFLALENLQKNFVQKFMDDSAKDKKSFFTIAYHLTNTIKRGETYKLIEKTFIDLEKKSLEKKLSPTHYIVKTTHSRSHLFALLHSFLNMETDSLYITVVSGKLLADGYDKDTIKWLQRNGLL
jgi:hypothetical protein